MLADLDAHDLAELERLRKAGTVRDYRSLRDLRDGMIEQAIREHPQGAQRLASPPLAS